MGKKPKIKVYVKPDSWIAALAARRLRVSSVAIVFGKTVYLHNTPVQAFLSDQSWVLHELKHVEQYERMGFMQFLYSYLRESFKKGYYANALEVEAREAECDASLLEKYELVT